MQLARSPRRQRLILLLVFIIFSAPMVVAWAMVEWRVGIPSQHTAHGEVMVEAPNLSTWPLVDEPMSKQDTWLLAFDCSSNCNQRMDELWRLHRALGREAPRLQRLRIGGRAQALPGEHVSQWHETPIWRHENMVWLVDPMGRPALAFNEAVSASAILDDIRHLFKVNPL
ncbi:hypothetical protein [Vreelandella olivaria]|uniref:hypothetical protein n=1 Tax=Vreelandella olivaria TaxID=390919 RepID=UPI00201EC1C4|nr:hypothetical protein [Halomonas olivaria]